MAKSGFVNIENRELLSENDKLRKENEELKERVKRLEAELTKRKNTEEKEQK